MGLANHGCGRWHCVESAHWLCLGGHWCCIFWCGVLESALDVLVMMSPLMHEEIVSCILTPVKTATHVRAIVK